MFVALCQEQQRLGFFAFAYGLTQLGDWAKNQKVFALVAGFIFALVALAQGSVDA